MTSVTKSYIWKSIEKKKKETINSRKVLKYRLFFDQESKRKLLNLISVDIFIKNNNVYDSGVKISISYA